MYCIVWVYVILCTRTYTLHVRVYIWFTVALAVMHAYLCMLQCLTQTCAVTPVHTWCIHSLHRSALYIYISCVFRLIILQPFVPCTVPWLEWISLLIGQGPLAWCAAAVKGLARSGTKDGFEQSVEKILRDEFQRRKWIGMELEQWMY